MIASTTFRFNLLLSDLGKIFNSVPNIDMFTYICVFNSCVFNVEGFDFSLWLDLKHL